MGSATTSPARYYMTRYRAKGEAFCRALTARGLKMQTEWKPQTHIPENHFRTYVRPATTAHPRRFIVAYVDRTLGGSVSKPAKFNAATKRKPRRLCVNGCARKNEALSGECHACRSRRLYREDPAYREKKRERARISKAKCLARRRTDADYRAAYNKRRREQRAKKLERQLQSLEES